jgi:predicted CoA-binding protein
MLGANFEEVKTKIQAPNKLKALAVVEYIRYHGRKIYAQSDSYLSANGYEIIPI